MTSWLFFQHPMVFRADLYVLESGEQVEWDRVLVHTKKSLVFPACNVLFELSFVLILRMQCPAHIYESESELGNITNDSQAWEAICMTMEYIFIYVSVWHGRTLLSCEGLGKHNSQ